MNKKPNTRRALVLSVLSLLLCTSLLIGSTFAWFTDTASTSVNTIESGTLQIGLYSDPDCKNSLEGETLTFVKAEGHEDEDILFEPGAKYKMTDVHLKNEGNLHAKYKITVSGISGDSALAEVLNVWVGDDNLGTLKSLVVEGTSIGVERHIAPKEVHTFGTIALEMDTKAGNEYQGKSISGIAITVTATQDTVEHDSFNNTYDENAAYDKVEYASSQDDLNTLISNAPADAPTTVVLPAGNFTMPAVTNKDITFTGSKDTVIDTTASLPATNGADITFDGVTVKFDDGENYKGFTHSEKVVYKNATINGKQFLYAEDVEFINCTFNNKADYNIWTYGAKNVTFTGCTFNTGGKAILVYTEGETHANITLNNCTFNSDKSLATDKAAVEVGSSPNSTATTYNIYINNCTQTDFAANSSTSPLWGNKNSMDKDHLNVVIDGTDVY